MNERRDGCEITRRAALGGLLAGAAGATLAGRAWAAPEPAPPPAPEPARSVIQIWMWGGPAHLDTFDPKPAAGADYCGPLNTPIATNVDGIQIGQLMPELAQQADKYAVLRAMSHGNNGHETASYIVQTGRQEGGRIVFPCVGAVVSRFRGYDAGYTGLIPPYIVLTTPQGRFDEAGCLGARYKPFATGGDPNARVFTVEGIILEGLTEERQRGRRELMHRLDSLGTAIPGDPRFAALDAAETAAYDLILGDAGKVFDLSTEPAELRDRYGRSTFGQSCLMARRLVEVGVPYITLNYGGWDTHKQHFETMRRKLPELDRGFGTLLADLADRGLLESTIVWWSGEFGRTPKVDWQAPWNGGRGHYGQCFSAVVAGGGFRGGQVIGASDATGSQPTERPVHPHELLGTIYGRMGIDPLGPLPNPRNLDLKVTDLTEPPALLAELS